MHIKAHGVRMRGIETMVGRRHAGATLTCGLIVVVSALFAARPQFVRAAERADEEMPTCTTIHKDYGDGVSSSSSPLCGDHWGNSVWTSILKPTLGQAGVAHVEWWNDGVARIIESDTVSPNARSVRWSKFSDVYTNYIVGAEVRWRGSGDLYCGFLTNQYDTSDYLMVDINRSGNLELGIKQGGAWQTSMWSTASIPSQTWVPMYVAQLHDRFYVFVNGQLAASFTNAQRAGAKGYVGILANNRGTSAASCDFRRAWVFPVRDWTYR